MFGWSNLIIEKSAKSDKPFICTKVSGYFCISHETSVEKAENEYPGGGKLYIEQEAIRNYNLFDRNDKENEEHMTLDEVLALESDWNVIIPMEKDRFCEIDEYLELVKNRTGEEKEQSQAEYLADYRNIVDYDTKEYSIQDLLKKFENNSIELSNLGRIDEFAFTYVIEHILLGVPIDDIMFKLEDDVMKITHNGDIINILHLFFENKFKLEGLNVLTKFEGMCFDDFDPSTKRKLSIKTLRMKHIISDKYNLLS